MGNDTIHAGVNKMKFKELTIQEYENFATQCVGRFYLNSCKMIGL